MAASPDGTLVVMTTCTRKTPAVPPACQVPKGLYLCSPGIHSRACCRPRHLHPHLVPDIDDLPGFEELFAKSIRKALDGMPVEERLAGLTPEERLAGLATEQVILALPVEVPRMLSEEHVRSLPPNVQETIKKRLQGAAH